MTPNVTFDAVGAGSSLTANGPGSISWSHTCTGDNGAVIVDVIVGTVSGNDEALTVGVTYGGVAMTSLGTVESGNSSGGNGFIQKFGLLSPPTGAQTVAVTVTGTWTANSNNTLIGNSKSYNGIAPLVFGTAVAVYAGADPNEVSTTSTSVASTVGNIVDAAACCGTNITGTGNTQEWMTNVNNHSGAGNAIGVTAPGGPSATVSFTAAGADFWGIVAVEIQVINQPYISAVGTLATSSSGTTLNVPVVSGVTAGALVLLVAMCENDTGTISPPAGFTRKTGPINTVTNNPNIWVFYKYATGSDSGNYTCTLPSSQYANGVSILIANGPTSGDPFGQFDAEASNTSSTANVATSLTTTASNALLIHITANEADQIGSVPSSGFTYLTGFSNTNSADLSIDQAVQAAVGSTGSVTGTIGTSHTSTAFLGAIYAPSVGGNSTIAYRDTATTEGNGSSTASFTIPGTVQTGDFLLLRYQETVVSGFTAPGTPTGWNFIGNVQTSSATLITVYYWKFAVSGDAGSTQTIAESSTNGQYITVVDAYSGTDPVNPLHAWALAGSPATAAATQIAPQVTITLSGCWVLEHCSDKLASGTEVMVPPGSSLVQRGQVSGSGGSRTTMTTADSGGPVPEGISGGELWTSSPSNSTVTATTGTIALAPASADTSPTGFVAAAGTNSTVGELTATVNVPSGVLASDLAVLLVSTGAGQPGYAMTCTDSAGTISYTQLFGSTSFSNGIGAAGALTGVSAGDVLTISWASHSFIPTILVAWYRGYTLTGYTLGPATGRTGTSQIATAAGLTTPAANNLVICCFIDRPASSGVPPYSSKVTVSGPVAYLDSFTAGANNTGGGTDNATASFVQGSAGATTAAIATFLGGTASTNSYAFQIAFPLLPTAGIAWLVG